MSGENISAKPINTIVTTTAEVDRLPLFELAATQTGCTVTVLAKEGQPYSFWTNRVDYRGGEAVRTDEMVLKTLTLEPGKVALAIERATDQKDHGPFWNALHMLESSSKTQDPK